VKTAGDIARRIVFRALAGLRGGAVVLRYPDGRGRRFGDRQGPSYVVEIRRPEALWEKLAFRTRITLGRSYVDGDWDCDELVGLFSLIGRNLPRGDDHPVVSLVQRLQRLRPALAERQTEDTARDNIHAHYDLGNELFTLMLDPTMAYSCAIWNEPGLTLEEAQRAKFRLVAEKLMLGPDDHLLEIGCGWGGFAIHAAREHGCRVTALTISSAQAGLARRRVAEAGVAERVAIVERDYRLVEGSFSRIVSIEMLEAIGYAEYDRYFATIDRLLAQDGIALVQVIGMPDSKFERYRRTPDWIQQFIFPGSLLPSLEVLARSVARTRLLLHDVEEIGAHYAPTLRAWRANVDANLDRIRDLGYDERFLRVWHFYLAYCESAFAIRSLRNMQLILARPLNDSLLSPAA
jgi:cyclopropane-fatty-acyl-phospholipid synthase